MPRRRCGGGGGVSATQAGRRWGRGGARVRAASSALGGVAVLGQGQLQGLLTDKSDHRQAILEALFRVERFKQIEQALKESAAQVSKRAATLRARREENLRQSAATTPQELAGRRQSV